MSALKKKTNLIKELDALRRLGRSRPRRSLRLMLKRWINHWSPLDQIQRRDAG